MNIFDLILVQPLTNGLLLFYRLLGGNMGFAIIAFSTFLRFVTNPLTTPYMNSMKKMKEVAPLVEKLKKKHKGDQKKLMAAQAELYKQKGINPTSGCLPYIIQIIILIGLFNVFNRVLSVDVSAFENTKEMLYPWLGIDLGSGLNNSFLYLDLSKPDTFKIEGLPFPIPGPLLILAGLLQFISAKMNLPLVQKEKKVVKATPSEVDDIAVSMQSSMVYTFPLMTIIFGINFASGLALYWLIFSIFQIYQQYQNSGWGGLSSYINKIKTIKLK